MRDVERELDLVARMQYARGMWIGLMRGQAITGRMPDDELEEAETRLKEATRNLINYHAAQSDKKHLAKR